MEGPAQRAAPSTSSAGSPRSTSRVTRRWTSGRSSTTAAASVGCVLRLHPRRAGPTGTPTRRQAVADGAVALLVERPLGLGVTEARVPSVRRVLGPARRTPRTGTRRGRCGASGSPARTARPPPPTCSQPSRPRRASGRASSAPPACWVDGDRSTAAGIDFTTPEADRAAGAPRPDARRRRARPSRWRCRRTRSRSTASTARGSPPCASPTSRTTTSTTTATSTRTSRRRRACSTPDACGRRGREPR